MIFGLDKLWNNNKETQNILNPYQEIYNQWKSDPESYWTELAKKIDWETPFEQTFEPNQGVYGRWFSGAKCNTCYNTVDRHANGARADQLALIYDSPVTGKKQTFTYLELKQEIEALAAVLKDNGVGKGDRVIIYMPMVPQAVFSMLACARIGAIHSVVFGGFAANELAVRIDDAQPKVIISASCGIEPNRVVPYKPMLDEAIETANKKPQKCIILQREQKQATLIEGRDLDYNQHVSLAKSSGRTIPCEPVDATDPLYILYTSGTTGQPKGVVRDNGGHMVALAWTMGAIYDTQPGDVYWAASDVGWVVGHSYIVYAPLLIGATTIVFEGKPVGTPDASTFWRIISEYNVKVLFTAPTAFRAIKKEDPDGKFIDQYDLSSLESLFLAGERADPDTIKWAEQRLEIPVIDHWWQTETGWAIAGNPIGIEHLPIKLGSATVPMPGFDVQILDNEGNEVANGTLGNVAIKLPLPPSCLPTLWNADERFHNTYLSRFKGYYNTSDAGIKDDDGYIHIMSRTDDIINVAGHRLSTGAIEEVIAYHPDVAECAVIGVQDDLKGQLPCGFIIINSGVTKNSSEIENECIALVREKIGPVAAFKQVYTVARLPKTRSGKILRGTMQKIADKQEWKMPATIDDPEILNEILQVIEERNQT